MLRYCRWFSLPLMLLILRCCRERCQLSPLLLITPLIFIFATLRWALLLRLLFPLFSRCLYDAALLIIFHVTSLYLYCHVPIRHALRCHCHYFFSSLSLRHAFFLHWCRRLPLTHMPAMLFIDAVYYDRCQRCLFSAIADAISFFISWCRLMPLFADDFYFCFAFAIFSCWWRFFDFSSSSLLWCADAAAISAIIIISLFIIISISLLILIAAISFRLRIFIDISFFAITDFLPLMPFLSFIFDAAAAYFFADYYAMPLSSSPLCRFLWWCRFCCQIIFCWHQPCLLLIFADTLIIRWWFLSFEFSIYFISLISIYHLLIIDWLLMRCFSIIIDDCHDVVYFDYFDWCCRLPQPPCLLSLLFPSTLMLFAFSFLWFSDAVPLILGHFRHFTSFDLLAFFR